MSSFLPTRGVRDAIKSWVPNWLSNRQGLSVGFAILYVIGQMCDSMIEAALEGVRAAWPGRGTPTALDLIGQGRGIIRGYLEGDDSYAARLVSWLTYWVNAGSEEVLLQMLQAFLGGGLIIQHVNRAGNFTRIQHDGSFIRVTDPSWNPDVVGEPGRSGWWSDVWLMVYVDGRWPIYANTSDAAWLAAWGTYDGFGVGHQVPRAVVDGVYAILASFKGAHTWVEWIAWCTDSSVFAPGSLGGPYNPNGKWAWWAFPDGSGNYPPVRTTATPGGYIRYWQPKNGG